jgi:hypothetical protein
MGRTSSTLTVLKLISATDPRGLTQTFSPADYRREKRSVLIDGSSIRAHSFVCFCLPCP